MSGDDDSKLNNFVIGVAVCLLASAASSLGVNLQAKALMSERERNRLAELAINVEQDVGIEDENILSEDYALLEQELNTNNIDKVVSQLRQHQQQSDWIVLFQKSQWYIGFILYLIAQTSGSIIALNFINPEIVAPLGATGLIFNMLFARLFLGTSIIWIDWVGTLMIVVGTAAVSVIGSINSTPSDDDKKSIEDLIRLYTHPSFLAYLIIQVSIILLLFIFIKYVEYGGPLKRFYEQESILFDENLNQSQSRQSRIQLYFDEILASPTVLNNNHNLQTQTETTENAPLLAAAGRGAGPSLSPRSPLSLSFSTGNALWSIRKQSASSLSTTESMWYRIRRWLRRKRRSFKIVGLLGALYSVIGGASAADTLIFANNGIEIVILSFQQSNQVHVLFALIILLALVLSVILQLYALNWGLNYSLPTIVVPLFYTLYTCLSFVNSVVIGFAVGAESIHGFWWIIVGLALIIAGVWMLGDKAGSDNPNQTTTTDLNNSQYGRFDDASLSSGSGLRIETPSGLQ